MVLFYTSAKYHRNILKGIQVTEWTQNLFQIKQRVTIPEVRKAVLSILYVTCHLALIYISTKYHKNIPKGIQATEQTRSFTPTPQTPTVSAPKTIYAYQRRGHNDKQRRSRSVGFFRSPLIWVYTVCKGRVYPDSAGLGLDPIWLLNSSRQDSNFLFSFREDKMKFCVNCPNDNSHEM